MNLEGKRVVVVGLALTGVAVAKFCVKRGARVVVTDGKPADKLKVDLRIEKAAPAGFKPVMIGDPK